MVAGLLAILGTDRNGRKNDSQDGKQYEFAQDTPPVGSVQFMVQQSAGMMRERQGKPRPSNALRPPRCLASKDCQEYATLFRYNDYS
jgi:hypothetical protein